MGYDYVKIEMKFTLLTPVKSAAPFHLRENLTGQAPVKSAAPFHLRENLTGQALLTYELNSGIGGIEELNQIEELWLTSPYAILFRTWSWRCRSPFMDWHCWTTSGRERLKPRVSWASRSPFAW
jgi:hypothetical protein